MKSRIEAAKDRFVLRGTFTVAEAVDQFEEAFWQGRMNTSAAKRTWEGLTAQTSRMPAAATLTMV